FDWAMALICLGFFVTIVASTRYVSLGTISATMLFVVVSFITAFGHTIYFQVFTFSMAFIVIFKHRENMQRLLSGTESRLTFGSSAGCPARAGRGLCGPSRSSAGPWSAPRSLCEAGLGDGERRDAALVERDAKPRTLGKRDAAVDDRRRLRHHVGG